MTDSDENVINSEVDAGLDNETSMTTAGTSGAALRALLAHAITTTTTPSPSYSKGISFTKASPPPPHPRSSGQSGQHAHIPSEILPRLFISDIFTALNAPTLRSFRITHVISVIEYAIAFPALPQPRAESESPSSLRDLDSPPEPAPLPLTTFHVPLMDLPSEDIFSCFAPTRDFIATALKDESARVLVHCYKGQSRSPTIVAAYLISTLKISTSDALKRIEKKLPIVLLNRGFRRQLEQWEVIVKEEDEIVYSEK